MKIVIDDQYQSDENGNSQYTIDENGNVNLFIKVDEDINGGSGINTGGTINASKIINDNNIINIAEDDNIVQSDFKKEDISGEEEEYYEDLNEGVEETSKTYGEERFLEERYKGYNSVYSEIESSLEEKYGKKEAPEAKGEIIVLSKLGSKDGVELKGARINLYILNGVSPRLFDSKFTDTRGIAEFKHLPNGAFRVISIVDRRFFEKPVYYNWNEVTIDKNNKLSNICVVNKIKQGYYRR
ncbi:MAG: calcium-binding protein [Clostridium sp.]|uniref:calcium-binding protein n=1 Tax=Clostridium sp. TaxID=1506 RepID=UPI00290D5B27|nr:calcium-binding protein [Clostridium sp.]MDU5111231.1 calcium-binding protein [Clostridium sp.]